MGSPLASPEVEILAGDNTLFSLYELGFLLDIRKNLLTDRVVNHWLIIGTGSTGSGGVAIPGNAQKVRCGDLVLVGGVSQRLGLI